MLAIIYATHFCFPILLQYPNIDPVAFSVAGVQVHWYGLMYLLGFILFMLLGRWRARNPDFGMTRQHVDDLLFYGVLGVILGGRLGYVLFYNFEQFIHDPWIVLMIWKGGMSFHGGLLGVLAALLLFARQRQMPFLQVTDFVAPLVPFGLGAGRIGNFINGELWGRVSEVPWAMVFPHVDMLPRHPTQLYQFLLEGIVLFGVLWSYSLKPRALGTTTGLFAVVYALARIAVELVRQPDAHIGFVAWGWLTMGQLLSVPLLLVGVWLMYRSRRYGRVL